MDKAPSFHPNRRPDTRRADVKVIEYDRELLQVRTLLLATILALAALIWAMPYGSLAKAATPPPVQTYDISLSDVVVADAECDAAPIFQGGDTNDDQKLDHTETRTYTCPIVDVDTTDTVAGVVGQAPVPGPQNLNLPIGRTGTGPVIPDNLDNNEPQHELYLPHVSH